jgi:predicted AlkP superfamily phosphohydrolase/phosphomutase
LTEILGNPRLVVIGIDGGCWDYLDPLLDSGQLPNLQHMIDNGLRGILKSTMPPITPAAWSSFITGKNPGKHGLFDFMVRTGDSFVPFSSAHRHGTSFWKYLNNSGFRVGVLGIPATYPPEEVDGYMIAGFGAPEGSRHLTWPPDLLDFIEDKYGTYKVIIPHQIADGKGLDYYLDATLENDSRQTRIAVDLAEQFRVDLLVINYQSADQLNHYARDCAYVEKALIGIDQNVGCILGRFPEANVMLVSDHGSRRLRGVFLLRNWLCEQGLVHYLPREICSLTAAELNHVLVRLLQGHYGWGGVGEQMLRRLLGELFSILPDWGKRSFLNALLRVVPYRFMHYQYTDQIDWENTQIYELSGYGGFYVNLQGRMPQSSECYKELRDHFFELLSSVRDPLTRKPLVQRVYKREELYSGPFVDLAPDLVADYDQSVYGFKPAGVQDNVDKSTLFMESTSYFGAHVRDGIFAFCGRSFKQSDGLVEAASIWDIPATVLHLFGIPIPEDYDGRVLTEYISEELMATAEVRFQAGDRELTGDVENPFSQEEMEGLEERLRSLGYIG